MSSHDSTCGLSLKPITAGREGGMQSLGWSLSLIRHLQTTDLRTGGCVALSFSLPVPTNGKAVAKTDGYLRANLCSPSLICSVCLLCCDLGQR